MKKQMKRVLSLFLTVVMLASMIVVAIPASAVTGESQYKPFSEQMLDAVDCYYIEDADDFYAFNTMLRADTTGATFKGKTIYLVNDIDLNPDWEGPATTIETGTRTLLASSTVGYFAGTFDGQGHTISGVMLEALSKASTGGIFGCAADGAVVKNLRLEKAYIATDKNGLGAIFAYTAKNATVNIENIYVASDVWVNYSGETAKVHVGGLIGGSNNSATTIKNSVFAGKINSEFVGEQYVGGILGLNNQTGTITLENCGFFGSISIAADAANSVNKTQVGKLVGRIQSKGGVTVNLTNCIGGGTGSYSDYRLSSGELIGSMVYVQSSAITCAVTNTIWLDMDKINLLTQLYDTKNGAKPEEGDTNFAGDDGTTFVNSCAVSTIALKGTVPENTVYTVGKTYPGKNWETDTTGYSGTRTYTATGAWDLTSTWEMTKDGSPMPRSLIKDTFENQMALGNTELYIYDTADYMAFYNHLANNAGSSFTFDTSKPWSAKGTGAFAGKTVKLANDITFNSNTGFDADNSDKYTQNSSYSFKGLKHKAFGGTFDGQGHTVSGICIVGSSLSHGSMFGYAIGNVTIKNVTFANCYIQTKNPGLAGLVSTVTAGADCTIENVRMASDFVLYSAITSASSDKGIAGLVGTITDSKCTIKNSVFEGILTTNSTVNLAGTGGLIGQVYSKNADTNCTIENSGFFGTIAWNTASSSGISKFIGRADCQTGTDTTVTINVNNCIVGGESGNSRIHGIVLGMSYPNTEGSKIELTITNSVWTKQTTVNGKGTTIDLTALPGSKYSGTPGDYSWSTPQSGFIPETSDFADFDAFLKGEVVNASGTSQGTADLTPYWTATAGNPLPTAMIDPAEGPVPADDRTGYVGYQLKVENDGTYSIRFVAKGSNVNYENVGMRVTVESDSYNTIETSASTTKVYTGIKGGAKEYTAEQFGATYLYTLKAGPVHANVGILTMTITTFHTEGGVQVDDTTVVRYLDTGAELENVLWLTEDYSIYAADSNVDASMLQDAISDKTGMTLAISNEPTDKCIWFGTADKMPAVAGIEESYTSYTISAQEDVIYVAAGSSRAPQGVGVASEMAVQALSEQAIRGTLTGY